MDIFQKMRGYFSNLVISVLKVLFIILIISTLVLTFAFFTNFDLPTIVLSMIYIGTIIISYFLMKTKKIKLSNKVLILILIGFLIRVLWNLDINAKPFSDFKTMYDSANLLIHGDNGAFKGFAYIARFPHLSYMVIYMSFFIKFFQNPVFIMKIVNLALSVLDMYLIYKITFEVFKKERLAICGLTVAALFPPMISYVGMLVTENIAIPFYLASIYLFVKYIDKKFKLPMVLLSGIILGLANLFRMVGSVMIVAYIIYILLYISSSFIDKLKKIACIALGFGIILLLANAALKYTNISEVNLWHGREPNITSILKGTNIESGGLFNVEDATLPEKYNFDEAKVKEEAGKIIKDRLTKTPLQRLATFYIGKFISQWSQGDMSGTYWSETGATDAGIKYKISYSAIFIFELFYAILIILSFIGLFNKKRIKERNSYINLFYIILCGYGMLYLITEMQARYGYIASFVFIIIAISGMEHRYLRE